MKQDTERIRSSLKATWDLFYHESGVIEVRALLKDAGKGPAWEGWGNTVLGYFDNFDAFAKSVIALEGTRRAKSTYLTLNPVGKDLAARAYNRLIGAKQNDGSSDKDIVTRRWLLIDCDPIRPEGISSTDEELQTAIGRAQEIETALTLRGWPAPIPGMSGNGAHRLYQIDLPNDETSRNLLEATLKSLQLQFGETDKEDEIGAQVMAGTIGIKVDMSVFNAARITKLYGTWVRKGDHLEGVRPHRLSYLESIPGALALVPVELLEREAAIYRDYQRSIDEEKAAQRAQQQAQRAGNNNNNDVIGAFNQAHPIDETLRRYEYTQGRGNRWSRPGKQDSLGVLVDDKVGKSYHFSDNDPMRNGHRVDSFDIYCYHEHGGDISKAIKTAAQELKIGVRPQTVTNGYHAPEPPDWAMAPPVDYEPTETKKDVPEWVVAPNQPTEPQTDNGGLVELWKVRGLTDAYKERPPLRFLVDGLLPCPSLSIVYGGPGSLKSMLLADMAVCVASGQKWLEPLHSDGTEPGHTFLVTQAPVFWIDFDNGTRRTDERIDAFARIRGLPADTPIHYVSMPSPWLNASLRPMIEELAKLILHLGAKMVVIDNLGLVTGDTEENSAGMAQVMGNLRWLCEFTESAVITIHHQRKSSAADHGARKGETLRGHSSIEAALDLALIIERKAGEDSVAVIPTKVRGHKIVDIFGAHFTYTHKADTYDLETARFFSVATESAEGKELRLIKETIKNQIREIGEPIKQGDLVTFVRDALAAQGFSVPGINRVRGILKEMADNHEIREFQAEKGKDNRAQFYDLTAKDKYDTV